MLDDQQFLKIVISDTGLGIKKDSLHKVFEPFERLDMDNSRVEGTGLGLSVVKELIEHMNGTIQVQSTYEVGSQFSFQIPVEIYEEDILKNSDSVKSNSSHKIKTDNLFGDLLIVEDNPSNIELISEIVSIYFDKLNVVIKEEGPSALS
jgi:hypothetical protein